MSGTIVTFYSWKGGVGRTMALANAAVQLARHGKHVLMVDWDLEAPGLSHYFLPSTASSVPGLTMATASDPSGLMGLLAAAAATSAGTLHAQEWQSRCALIRVPPLPESPRSSPPPTPAPLHLLPTGHGSAAFTKSLTGFSWPD